MIRNKTSHQSNQKTYSGYCIQCCIKYEYSRAEKVVKVLGIITYKHEFELVSYESINLKTIRNKMFT